MAVKKMKMRFMATVLLRIVVVVRRDLNRWCGWRSKDPRRCKQIAEGCGGVGARHPYVNRLSS